MRIDRLLWFLRFARSRRLAQEWVAEGHIRRNGVRVTRRDQAVAAGDILTLPLRQNVLVIEILSLPLRRGPAQEAQACYRALDAGQSVVLAGGQQDKREG
ncbi:MAG TPA: S4 domain-containing protein [Erythrobacter sp.]|nr:S4 domain-containing protein [Erythrobacter sp.]